MYWKQELLEGENRMVYDKIMLVMDSVGLGVFTVMGRDKGITEGYMGRTFFPCVPWNGYGRWRRTDP